MLAFACSSQGRGRASHLLCQRTPERPAQSSCRVSMVSPIANQRCRKDCQASIYKAGRHLGRGPQLSHLAQHEDCDGFRGILQGILHQGPNVQQHHIQRLRKAQPLNCVEVVSGHKVAAPSTPNVMIPWKSCLEDIRAIVVVVDS